MLITTHYMDEADVLGDRICILREGTVVCCGSPLFLKTRYGVGYQIRIAIAQSAKVNEIKRVFNHLEVLKWSANKTEIEVKVADSERMKF